MELKKYYKNIYIVCPPNYRTGGVELLHQLIYSISENRDNVFCVYESLENYDYEIVEDYKKYVSSYILSSDIEDSENNLLIVPEINISFLKNTHLLFHLPR